MKHAITAAALLAATALAGCEAEPGRAASPGTPVAGAAQAAQQGIGTDQESRFVTQRGGSSVAMQGGRITGQTGMNVGVTRAGPGVSQPGARVTGVQQAGGGDVTIQREGVGAPEAGSGETRRSAQRRQRQQQQQQQAPAQPPQ